MARLTYLEVSGYRSIDGDLCVRVPPGKPLVIVGENNAGKSNIIRAIDLLLGDRWPGSWAPEDHEFYGRDPSGAIRICGDVDGVAWNRTGVERIVLTNSAGRSEINIELEDGSQRWPNNETRAQLPCVLINADRRLSYQLSYASQWTMLSKLMHRFHKALTADPDRRDALKAHFDALHEIFDGVPEFSVFVERLQDEVGQLGGNMPYGLEIDFSAYDPSNFFRALRVTPKLDGEHRSYDELGTGQEQILALGFAYAYAAAFGATGEGLVLVIEEPEAHLHPLAQDWLASQLHRFTAEGVQVIVTTHSPAFIDLRNLDALVLVRKVAGATCVSQLTAAELADYCRNHGAPKAMADSILEHYDINSTPALRAGFFARAVILVEGATEEFALPVLLRHLGLDLVGTGVACIPVGGKGNLAKWWRLFTAFEIPTYVIFDNDTSDDGSGAKRCDVLCALGIGTEEQSAYLETTELVVRPGFSVMGVDFEATLRGLLPEYAALEVECADVNGQMGKPFVARWVAERLTDVDSERLAELAGRLREIAAAS